MAEKFIRIDTKDLENQNENFQDCKIISVVTEYSEEADGEKVYSNYAIIEDQGIEVKIEELIEKHQIRYGSIVLGSNEDDFEIIHGRTKYELYDKINEFFNKEESKDFFIDFTGWHIAANKYGQKIYFVYVFKHLSELQDF